MKVMGRAQLNERFIGIFVLMLINPSQFYTLSNGTLVELFV